MLSKEELLKPRYKVIADYPGNLMAIGNVLQFDWHLENQIIELCHYYNKYPHLFKKLEWWEGREKYFWSDGKCSSPLFVSNIGKTFYGTAWGINIETGYFTFEVNGEPTKAHLSNFLPADESEYNLYLQSLK